MSAIAVSNLGKAYKQYSSRWARLAEWLFPFLGERHQLKWVLKDISFSVQPGEALGIIGINGAGKSTLLKMITGTVQPTEGTVKIIGKVAALLELGMGFHPDFTGRQNVYMAGQLLGYSTAEITTLMPEIEAFAEIGDYIDQPVRVYSSGMQMRLAFSVATVRCPDILIVDEALSVGDAYFQHKSFERIREFRKTGTTLLMVSHDKAAIQSICDKAILLTRGAILMEGPPQIVMDLYNARLSDLEGENTQQLLIGSSLIKTISGSKAASISIVEIVGENYQILQVVQTGQVVTLRVLFKCNQNIDNMVVGYIIKDRLGLIVYGTNTYHQNFCIPMLKKNDIYECLFEFRANMGPGHYSVSVALHSGPTHIERNYEWQDRALIFEVSNSSENDFIGVSWMPPTVKGRND